ncbi:tax1-binding protein 1 homolog isoform X2 [Neocloeon triangulifer]|nr:tax1-binding protein 1 homolog isoform X2 [Neocloeon triangulifer]
MDFEHGSVCLESDHKALSTSQYAMVVFQDILDSYPTDADVCCRYSLNSDLEVEEGDYIALFKIGWTNTDEAILKHPALSPDVQSKQGGIVIFRADALPKDEQEFYQLCYVNVDGSVCGASVPFQFRRSHEAELCMHLMDDSMVVVRSRTAVVEDKLRKLQENHSDAQLEKVKLADELAKVKRELDKAREEISNMKATTEAEIAEKNSLLQILESSKQRERHVMKLQSEIKSLDESRNSTCNDLRISKQNIDALTATVETLSADKTRMAGLLRENVRRGDEMSQELQEKNHILAEMEQKISLFTQECQNLQKEKEKLTENLRLQTKNATERELHLLNELTTLRTSLLNAERVQQDVDLLREHRSNLEQQLHLTDEKYRDLKAAYGDLQKRETDLVNQVLKLSQKLTDPEPHSLQLCNHCSNSTVKITKLEEQVADLRIRLDQGAEEYKKVYVEKCKVEKKLSKSAGKRSSSSKENALSGDVTPGDGSSSRVCPMCKVTFPAGSSDLFTQHFENHLS